MFKKQINRREFIKLVSGIGIIGGLEFILGCSKKEESKTTEELAQYLMEKEILRSEDEKKLFISQTKYGEQIEKNEKSITYILRGISLKEENYRVKYGEYLPLEKLIDKKYIEESVGYFLVQAEFDKEQDAWGFKAVPLQQGKTGINSYFVDQSGIIYISTNPNFYYKGELYEPPPGLTYEEAKKLDEIRKLTK